MRIVISLLILGLVGCATTDKFGCRKPGFVNRAFNKAPMENYNSCVSENDPAQIQERNAQAKWREAADNALELGTPKSIFDHYYRTPDRKELIDGKTVYWYDGAVPFYIVFKDDKVNSIIQDNETIKDRAESAERRAAERRNRNEAMLGVLSNSLQNQSNQRKMDDMNNRLYQQQQQINTLQNNQGGPVRVINPQTGGY